MAQLISDRRDVDFVLHEQIGTVEHEKFAEFDKKTIDLIVTEARNLAIKEILPTQKLGDEEGCTLENGEVKVPESFHRVYKIFNEGEWLAMTDDPDWGGQGMPKTVALAANEYMIGANPSFMLYIGMTHGAARLVESFGTKEQKDLYLENMFSGKWGGTMLLTEPEAGSDVGALITTATKNEDGTYSINGSKIFISSGDNDLVENIIHPVLARVEGAPEGTKGISLFLVPKYKVNDDGSLGEFNNVECVGLEEKMGIHGNATATLALGQKGESTGTLLGEENKGMAEMFVMMNEARVFVGLQGFSVASASYMYALDYAKTRIQGRHMLAGKDRGYENVRIIEHPDVRRQLLTMKAYVDGMRSLLYYNAKCLDIAGCTEDENEKAEYSGLAEVLTPIVKGYITDRALEVCSHGVQVFGGYGYTKDFPAEQLMRDSRIFMIYEGTNGIQAIDLMGRKLNMAVGKVFENFLSKIKETIENASGIEGVEALAEKVKLVMTKYEELVKEIKERNNVGNVLNTFSFAHPFLEITGDLSVAWMLLWRASVAAPKLLKKAGSLEQAIIAEKASKNKDVAFYAGQVQTAKFFINKIIPATMGKMDAVFEGDTSVEDMPEASFGSK
ncbi:MAG: acyl-CoA dehydrogenase [Desulfobacteraceae bacterium]|nr:acyl-CoA dehydrogenase [Desulfobacteraceae bacterium]